MRKALAMKDSLSVKDNSSRTRILSILVLGVLIGISIWFGLAFASTEEFHHKDIAYLEEKQNNAKALSASASAASVLISLLPEDTATPLANQIAEIGRDFLIVLSALAAEQYLLTITGRITFCWLIPIALGILILFVLMRRKLFLQIGVKLAIAGCVLYMLVPLTLRITRLVDGPYEEAVDKSLQQSKEIEEAFHYNEDGIVMPGMSGTETAAQSETQTAAQAETQTAAQDAAQTETQAEVQTEVQSELQTVSQTEKRESEKEPEKKPKKKKPKKKKPWYERLWDAIAGTASDAADTVSKVPEKVANTASGAADKVTDAAHKIADTASDAVHNVADAAHKAADTASDAAQKAADTTSDAVQKVSDTASTAVGKVVEAGEKVIDVAEMTPQVPQMAADLLNNLINAFVLMIVTTCVLPLFVLIGLLWVMNQVLNINPDWEKQTP